MDTSKQYPNNVTFKLTHFEMYNEKGDEYEVKYENSYFVKLSLIKKNDWGPFSKVEQLTKEGILYIESYLEDAEPILWRSYIENR